MRDLWLGTIGLAIFLGGGHADPIAPMHDPKGGGLLDRAAGVSPFWRPEGAQQESPGRQPWVIGSSRKEALKGRSSLPHPCRSRALGFPVEPFQGPVQGFEIGQALRTTSMEPGTLLEAAKSAPLASPPNQALGSKVQTDLVLTDRLLAAVNGMVLTQGDLELARSLNAVLLFGRGRQDPGLRQEVERLIDLELFRQELERFSVAAAEEGQVRARLDELRRGYAEIGGLPVLLRRLGLQESELTDYLQLQALVLKFIGLRFRPFVSVSDDEVESYYRDVLVAELLKTASAPPPLSEVAEQIRGLLTEDKVNEAMEEWIRSIRGGARIQLFMDADAARGVRRP